MSFLTLDPVILDYLFSTFPSRLQVSTGSTPASGRIDVSVSSGNTDKYCKQILVAVPIGSGKTDFSEQTPSAAVNTANWSPSSQEIMTGEDLGLNDEVGASYATFTFDAKDSSVYKIDYNLVISLTATVNAEVGSFAYIVRETSGADASTMTEKQSTFTLDKAAPSFYLENLVATTTSSPLAPATEFANGTAIRLAWESNGTWFQVYEKNNAKPIYAGPGKTCEVSGGAKTDTTFFLQASMTGDPGDDTGKFEPIYLFDSITITISNPDLTPASVECSGGISGTTLKATGTATLSDVAASGTLNVTGQTTLAGATAGDITVSSLTDNGTLHVTGQSTLAGVTAGDTTVSSLTSNGSLTAKAGAVSMFGSGVKLAEAVSIPNTRVYAKTDGFAVAQVLTPGDNAKMSYNYAYIFAAGTWFQIQGGTVGSFGSGWDDYMNTNPSSMCLPIPARTYWQYYSAVPSNNQLNSNTQIWWFPIGSTSSGDETYRILSESEAVDMVPHPEVPTCEPVKRQIAQEEEFIGRLARLFKSLDEGARAELAELLRG